MPLDGEVTPIDRPAERSSGPERHPAQNLIRLADLRDPGRRLQVEGRVVVRVRRKARAVVERGAEVEFEFGHARFSPTGLLTATAKGVLG